MSRLRYFGVFWVLFVALFVTACKDEDPETLYGPSDPDESLYPYNNGMLSGFFDVGDNRFVRFSRGNLQYRASTNEWRFAPNQWDCIGARNSAISATDTGWIDLFAWGATGCDSLRPPYVSSYDTNIRPSSHSGPDDPCDWGVFDTITNADIVPNGFFTLTLQQWNYIIYLRYDARNRRGFANVNGVNGLVLLPEQWFYPDGISFIPDTMRASDPRPTPDKAINFPNRYSKSDWLAMEREGAVFLPFAGKRSRTTVSYYNLEGFYWSMTHTSNPHSYRYFNVRKLKDDNDYFFRGYSVRLVQYVVDVDK